MRAQVAADLRAAAEVLRRDGWTRKTYHDACGHCVQGAIAVAVGRGRAPSPERWKPNSPTQLRFDRCNIALHEELMRGYAYHGQTHVWNDYLARNADEVIAALEAAADRAEVDQ